MRSITNSKLTFLAIVAVLAAVLVAGATFSVAKPDKVDGINVPSGRIPQEIKNNKLSQDVLSPEQRRLGKDEMRITALGTGMPTQSPSNVSCVRFWLSLAMATRFLFDLGTGSTDRLAGLEADYSKLDKVFISHLHTDHAGDIAALWVAGWLNGRYTPLQIYGPSGSSPELGTKVHVDHIRERLGVGRDVPSWHFAECRWRDRCPRIRLLQNCRHLQREWRQSDEFSGHPYP